MKSSHGAVAYAPDVDALTEAAVDLIWGQYPGYSEQSFPKSELVPSVRDNVRLAVDVIRREQPPMTEELAVRRTLGTQRARQSVPLESVIQAYRCTERVILLDVLSGTRRLPDGLTSRYADLVISTFDLLAQGVIDTYHEASSAIRAARQLLETDLVLGLASGVAPEASDVERWSRALEIDPEAPFMAIAVRATSGRAADQVEVQRLRRRLSAALRPHLHTDVLFGETSEVVLAIFSPGIGRPEVCDVLRSVLEQGDRTGLFVAGVGDVCRSLRDAAVSCAQARDAAAVGRAGPGGAVVSHESVLLDVLLLRQPEISRELVDSNLGALAGSEHLIDTLRSLVRNDMSQAAVARDLYVHLNTVANRLRRIHELTGLNPLKLADLMRLAVALRYEELEGAAART